MEGRKDRKEERRKEEGGGGEEEGNSGRNDKGEGLRQSRAQGRKHGWEGNK